MSTHATVDFETYSSAGYLWDGERWVPVNDSGTPGIAAVGAPAYAEHPSTEVLCMAYRLPRQPPRLWTPSQPAPSDLFAFIAAGGLVEAHNSGFESYIWQHVCVPRLGWPALPAAQVRCSMARSRAHGLPGALADVATALGTEQQKDTEGKRLIAKFCKPRQPTGTLRNVYWKKREDVPRSLWGTVLSRWDNPNVQVVLDEQAFNRITSSTEGFKAWFYVGGDSRWVGPNHCASQKQSKSSDPRTRIRPEDDPEDFKRLCDYCLQDIATEEAISALLPPLLPEELELWQLDQRINSTGVAIDLRALDDFQALVDQLAPTLTAELVQLTNGAVQSPSEVARIIGFLAALGVTTKTLDSDAVDALLASQIPPVARRVLEIRKALGSASVKKLGAIRRRLSRDGRLRDLFQYCGAERTGRFAGRGPQPQNLPSSGPPLVHCSACGHYHGDLSAGYCMSCGSTDVRQTEWTSDAVRDVLGCRSLESFRLQWPDVLGTISGSLRGLFVAAPGHDFICSDYSAIEAVVLAELAGEQWRHEVFMTHGKIYEMSAAKITGIPFEEFAAHKQRTGEHHPMRKRVGKVAELACLGASTMVLTSVGWKKITDVTTADLLHDGTGWIEHEGVVSRGDKHCLIKFGVHLTRDHKVYDHCGGWVEAGKIRRPEWKSLCWDTVFDIINSTGEFPTVPIGVVGGPGVHPVFDILNAGPRNRFVILTAEGPLIVHNSGYQGGLGAWKAFGADKFMTDSEIQANVKAWREASPMIVQFWKQVENAAIQAVRTGRPHSYRGITYHVAGKVLYCTLLSGRRLAYHDPVVTATQTPWGSDSWKLTHMINAQVGGWQRDNTYGGKLTENIVQATARDILTAAMVRLDRAGYKPVLHVHDEICCEVPEGWGSVEEMERIMGEMPPWAAGWPIRAAGGWREKRYKK